MREPGEAHVRHVLAAAVAAGVLMLSCRDWPQADAFARELRCGMSIDEVRARARAFGADELIADARVPHRYGTHVVAKGSSRVYLDFGAKGLTWTRSGGQSGLWTGMRIGVKHDLCRGKDLVSLVIRGSTNWERATVEVNGVVVGTLSSGPVAMLEIDVPLGPSHILIRSSAMTYRKSFSFSRDSDGIEEIELPR